ncbi:MAG: hypothetical protein M5U31_06250 [Acidimicrobiia bacterium]|nr:hypothetical protein [Acidimicrobiia bacterium]
MPRLRQISRIAPLVALALVGAACSSGSEPEVTLEFGDGAPTVEESVEIVSSAATAVESASFTGEGTVVEGGELGFASLEGTADFTSGNGESTSSFETDGGDVGVEWRRVDGNSYFKQSGEFVPTGLEDTWVRVDPTEIPEGVEMEGFAEFQNGPWAQYLTLLQVVTNVVPNASTEDVNGVEARGFEADLDVAAAIEDGVDPAGESLDAETVAHLESFVGSFGETARLDVWIDNEGRPVRLAVRSRDTEANMTLEISDFGVDVDVDEPSSDETIGLEEFLNQTIGSAFTNFDPDDVEFEVNGEPVPTDGDSSTDETTTTTEQSTSSDEPSDGDPPPTGHDPNVGY